MATAPAVSEPATLEQLFTVYGGMDKDTAKDEAAHAVGFLKALLAAKSEQDGQTAQTA